MGIVEICIRGCKTQPAVYLKVTTAVIVTDSKRSVVFLGISTVLTFQPHSVTRIKATATLKRSDRCKL